MTELRVEDPHLVENKNVDSAGRVYVGKDLSGESVQVIINRNDEEAEADA